MAARMGRPRGFDRTEAIERALRLFWEHGYDSTSLEQLRAAMGGISAASFYAAFGSKEALFREAVERYVATYGQAIAPLWNLALSPRAAVEQALRNSACMQTDKAHPQGCLLVFGATACAPGTRQISEVLVGEREHARSGLRTCLTRARDNGEIAPTKNIEALVVLFETFLFGISPQARDDVSADALNIAISEVMTLLDGP